MSTLIKELPDTRKAFCNLVGGLITVYYSSENPELRFHIRDCVLRAHNEGNVEPTEIVQEVFNPTVNEQGELV